MDQSDALPIRSQYFHPRTRREAIYEKFNGMCHWCGRKTFIQKAAAGVKTEALCATVDHVIPRWRGGTNATTNLVLACHLCNQRRNKEDHLGLEEGALLRQPIPVQKPKKISRSGGHIALTADEKALLMARMEAKDRSKLESSLKQSEERYRALEGKMEVLRLQKNDIESELHLARIELKHQRKALIQMQADWKELTLLKFIRMRLWRKR